MRNVEDQPITPKIVALIAAVVITVSSMIFAAGMYSARLSYVESAVTELKADQRAHTDTLNRLSVDVRLIADWVEQQKQAKKSP